MAPRLLGADAAPLTALTGNEAQSSSRRFRYQSVERLDADREAHLESRRAERVAACGASRN